MQYINKEKLDKIKLEPSNMYVVIDFDRTITAGDSQDSWDAAATLLNKEFKEESYKLYKKYRPIEQDYTITFEEKTKAMEIWYQSCMNLYYKYNLTKQKLIDAVKESKLKFREGAQEFLEQMYKNNIPVIICSAGIGNIIEIFLKQNNCYYDNIYIVSNFLTFDKNGKIEKYKDKLIHTMNKTINGNLPLKLEQELKKRKYKLLLGDTIEDKQMLDAKEKPNIITVGFLNDKIEQNTDKYKKEFDICLIGEENFKTMPINLEKSKYDVIIIGGGPAGVSASLYTQRANLDTLILYAKSCQEEKSALEKTEKIENYYGFENGIDGKSLYENGIAQAQNIGVKTSQEEVIRIEKEGDIFTVDTTENKYNAKVVIISTGNKKNKPDIQGINELEGKGVSYCATCDAFFYKDKDVGVIGSGDYAISEVNDLLNVVNKITILTNGKKEPDFRAENVAKLGELLAKNGVFSLSHPGKKAPELAGLTPIKTRSYARANISLYRHTF